MGAGEVGGEKNRTDEAGDAMLVEDEHGDNDGNDISSSSLIRSDIGIIIIC